MSWCKYRKAAPVTSELVLERARQDKVGGIYAIFPSEIGCFGVILKIVE